MPKAQDGPRIIDKSGTYYAIRMINGKKACKSLGTRNKAEAQRRWYQAMVELEEQLRPAPKSAEPHLYGDPDTGAEWWGPSPWTEEELEEEASEGFSWSDAIAITKARHRRRRGREMSSSQLDAIKQALRFTKAGPLELDPREIRRMILRMEEKGHKATTIQQRCSALSSVIDAVIRSGEYPDHDNPFRKVDTAAVADEGSSHKTPTPEEYQMVWESRASLDETPRLILELLIYSGARISEVLNASYEESLASGDHRGGWMLIRKTPAGWQPKNKTSIRDVPIPQWLAKKAAAHGAPFTIITADGFRARYQRIRGDLEITPHSFRHGYKTAGRIAGADELTVETILGHAAGSKMSRAYGRYPRELLLREAEKVWKTIDEWVGMSGVETSITAVDHSGLR